jgi:hypothetical protein
VSKSFRSNRASLDFTSDLPIAGTRNWSAQRKAAVVLAVRSGTLHRVEAYERYMLSEEELAQWEAAFTSDGIAGLQLKNISLRKR